jgi:uncharacterized protein (DUF4415 family)
VSGNWRIFFKFIGNQERTKSVFQEAMMRKEYDFENMESRKNPYAGNLKKQVTIRIGVDIIDYFKKQAEETGVPYQNLINLYLRDCVQSNRKLSINWTRSDIAFLMCPDEVDLLDPGGIMSFLELNRGTGAKSCSANLAVTVSGLPAGQHSIWRG